MEERAPVPGRSLTRCRMCSETCSAAGCLLSLLQPRGSDSPVRRNLVLSVRCPQAISVWPVKHDGFSQIGGSAAFSPHIVSLTSTTYGLLTLDPSPDCIH
ncbi:glutaredoxin family protein [Striga asiatica]|uniref:Glutaredoxin family protein n=1 Tax=Striga asiatica TaxID=4170 RepID=A0A5A7QA48_STRAF|nr:glutaredoxin family protein [Striga asiatica]